MTQQPRRRLATTVAGSLLAVGLLGACSSGDDVPLAPAPSTATGGPSSGGAAGTSSPTGAAPGTTAPGSTAPDSTAPGSTDAPTGTVTPPRAPTPVPRTLPAPSSGLPVPVPTGATPED